MAIGSKMKNVYKFIVRNIIGRNEKLLHEINYFAFYFTSLPSYIQYDQNINDTDTAQIISVFIIFITQPVFQCIIIHFEKSLLKKQINLEVQKYYVSKFL